MTEMTIAQMFLFVWQSAAGLTQTITQAQEAQA